MINEIRNVFNNRPANIMGNYKRNAVMLLLCEEGNETYIIFEVRAFSLRHQPGDICLPGGKIESGETPREAALRETMEELNLIENDIEYIGEMDYFISPYGSIMYPFVAKLNTKVVNPNNDEVDHIFKVPLKYLLEEEPQLYEMEIGPNLKEDFPYDLVKDGRNYKFSRGKLDQYFYKYDKYIIWGFTAMIVKNFIDIIKKEARF
ncbi:hydrolase, NUDIX family [Clostridiales bacterium oral taxon 876 str. F0540]|nr:hydrolase, NUDIX family [Clostridiales bacterium oral taxon 876 str. F0540]